MHHSISTQYDNKNDYSPNGPTGTLNLSEVPKIEEKESNYKFGNENIVSNC